MEYSVKQDAIYCFPCRIFPSGIAEVTFTKTGFRNWKKMKEKCDKHVRSEAHKNSMTLWAGFKQAEIEGSVANQLAVHRVATIKENRRFLNSIAKVAILCAQQNISLRGHDEGPNSLNKGNFREILDLLASENSQLLHRMQNSPKNAKYVSSDTQNDLLQAASAVLLQQITTEVKKANAFAVIADETRDLSYIEQLSICVRYVNADR